MNHPTQPKTNPKAKKLMKLPPSHNVGGMSDPICLQFQPLTSTKSIALERPQGIPPSNLYQCHGMALSTAVDLHSIFSMFFQLTDRISHLFKPTLTNYSYTYLVEPPADHPAGVFSKRIKEKTPHLGEICSGVYRFFFGSRCLGNAIVLYFRKFGFLISLE